MVIVNENKVTSTASEMEGLSRQKFAVKVSRLPYLSLFKWAYISGNSPLYISVDC